MSIKGKLWTDEEKQFLIKNYFNKGSKFCVIILNRTMSSVIQQATKLGLKSNKNNYTKKEIDFLKKHFVEEGVNFCKKHLKRSVGGIYAKAHELNLHIKQDLKGKHISDSRDKINYKKYNIINFSNKYVVYFLGFFWADGYLKKTNFFSEIRLVDKDAIFLYDVISKYTNCFYLSKSKKTYTKNKLGLIVQNQDQKSIRSFSHQLYHFLIENDYLNKSRFNFNKIFSKINDDLKPYFILGLFDGDGCFIYNNKKISASRFDICSTYEYDWSTLENYFNEKNIEYKIYKNIRESSKGSTFVVKKIKSLIKLFELLYNSDFHGLDRKYIKFLKFYENIKK